jgi:phosphatidylglycerol:prolipoprotein diacylglycerol transferase
MLAIAFIAASYLLTKEFKRLKLNPDIASNITLIALIGGVAGSKILYLLEHWSSFIADPSSAFSPGGLTFYGGLVLAAISIFFYVRGKKISFLLAADLTSPGLILAYGIGRLGCHFAGDGDYGFPTTLPWGTNYANGTYPPSQAFRDFPEITSQFPNGIVPDTTPCHPTGVYELLVCSFLAFVLWNIRLKTKPAGKLFMIYLMAAGVERLTIEFARLNPRLFFGLSEAQLISLALITGGAIGFAMLFRSAKLPETKP